MERLIASCRVDLTVGLIVAVLLVLGFMVVFPSLDSDEKADAVVIICLLAVGIAATVAKLWVLC